MVYYGCYDCRLPAQSVPAAGLWQLHHVQFDLAPKSTAPASQADITSVPPDLHTPMAVIHVSVRPATSTCEPRP